MEAKMVLYAVVIVIAVAVAIFTSLDVFFALKTARGYFNIWYRYEYGTEFCRARLAGKVDWFDNKALYVVEIHPKDAAKAYAWTVSETRLCGGRYGRHLLEKGRFYKYAFKEELYD